MDEEDFQRIADAGFLGFRIHGEGGRHGEVGILVGEKVANAVVMLDDRHPGERHDRLDESLSAAWNDEVEPFIHPCQHRDAFPIGERDELDRMVRPARFCEGRSDGDVRVNRLAAASQDGGITRFKAQHGSISGDVWAALVNDADGADGHAGLGNADTVRASPCVHDLADGVWQSGDLLDAGSHRFDPLIVEHQAVEHGAGKSLLAARFEVFRICGEDSRCRFADGDCHGTQNGVFFIRSQRGKLIGGSPCLATHLVDDFLGGGHGTEFP